ncbi:16S rRNA (cytosine(1402)-N(4))-methyltransferase RsmH [Candidatus Zixiibacteriota bacterium]
MVTSTRRAASPSQEKHPHLHHVAVMANEVVRYLLTDPTGIYVDCTLGAGGHSMAMLGSMDLRGTLVGIDRDEWAIDAFREKTAGASSTIHLFQAPFSQLREILGSLEINQINGLLLDLGMASFQIDLPERGFSYQLRGPLDMRMDVKQQLTGSCVINEYPEEALSRVIREYGQERRWRRAARAIVLAREDGPIENTQQLAEIIRKAIPGPQIIKSLSRIFQSIRVEVNGELNELETVLPAAVDMLKSGGRLVVLCYQSLEDRLVKSTFAHFSGICRCPKDLPRCICDPQRILKVLTKRAVRPSAREVRHNPRARSARLRAAEIINHEERDAQGC